MLLSNALVSVAGVLAQTGGQAEPTFAQKAFGPISIVLIFVIFYFLLIRPQQKRQKEHRKMIEGLAKGDRVVTSGGMYGVVVGLDENKVVLKVAENVKVEFAKSAVATILSRE
jgi:preprotein translocase subunit YajC